ncbi:Membrane spanning protein [Serinicoccus hydrothermalis]|uniref:Membrane spanning protein n=2 Tax=Serinicoccus hydrothermalis TaxID=1758689 RepID=A0A1B1NCT6_9MICO|nr:Membrane spanning protein [Serinicoccus hydrothermalis]
MTCGQLAPAGRHAEADHDEAHPDPEVPVADRADRPLAPGDVEDRHPQDAHDHEGAHHRHEPRGVARQALGLGAGLAGAFGALARTLSAARLGHVRLLRGGSGQDIRPIPWVVMTDDVGEGTATARRGRVVGVTAVCLAAGMLFGTSASLAREGGGAPADLVDLITERDAQVQDLTGRADDLADEVEQLRAEQASSVASLDARRADELALGVGAAAAQGPAVGVTLDDAGYSLDTLPEGYSVDDVVVHQQDLQGVVNALWAGGAEAIMVQDQRIVSTSAVQCVGNTLYLQGRVYSPPYTVTAIGDPEALRSSLAADPVVSTYRDWAQAVGLGYDVEDLGETELPAYAGAVRPQHASVVRP